MARRKAPHHLTQISRYNRAVNDLLAPRKEFAWKYLAIQGGVDMLFVPCCNPFLGSVLWAAPQAIGPVRIRGLAHPRDNAGQDVC